jgi:3-oxoacyl-[acyl-carrier-protein] synthase III
MKLPCYIVGIGHHLPANVVRNEDLPAPLNEDPEGIERRTGITERRWENEKRYPSDLGTDAAIAALADAGWAAADVDCIIASTISPDHMFPGIGCYIQRKLEIPGIPAYDLRAQCSGFLYGINMARAFITSGIYKKILLVCAEIQSRGLGNRPEDAGVTPLFADGAAAVCITGPEAPPARSSAQGPGEAAPSRVSADAAQVGGSSAQGPGEAVPSRVSADAAQVGGSSAQGPGEAVPSRVSADDPKGRRIRIDELFVAADGRGADRLRQRIWDLSVKPFSDWTLFASSHADCWNPYMEGQYVFRQAISGMSKASKKLLEEAKLSLDDVDWLLPHQANLNITKTVASVLSFPMERVLSNIQTRGNTTSASIPLLLSESLADGKVKVGQRVLATAFGAGLTWGACLLVVEA